mmetsp:Transcript_45020/g.107036  ORF Transcript_45020/g.107036 Transcript_45020/m.107036 type:complete len:186 (-) Transcript_45020:85-642(-)
MDAPEVTPDEESQEAKQLQSFVDGARKRSLTNSSSISLPDSEFGLSERQLREAGTKPTCETRSLSLGRVSEGADADFGLADEQIKALTAEVTRGRRNSELERSPERTLPALEEVSETDSAGPSPHLLGQESRSSSLARFERSDSFSLTQAARGAGSAGWQPRPRGLACLGRARLCFEAFLGRAGD